MLPRYTLLDEQHGAFADPVGTGDGVEGTKVFQDGQNLRIRQLGAAMIFAERHTPVIAALDVVFTVGRPSDVARVDAGFGAAGVRGAESVRWTMSAFADNPVDGRIGQGRVACAGLAPRPQDAFVGVGLDGGVDKGLFLHRGVIQYT